MKQKLEPLFIKFEIFNINQLLDFEIAKFLFFFQKISLSQSFNNYFYYFKDITFCQSRKAEKNDFYLLLYKAKRAHLLKNQPNSWELRFGIIHP